MSHFRQHIITAISSTAATSNWMKIHFTRAQVRKPLQFRCCNSVAYLRILCAFWVSAIHTMMACCAARKSVPSFCFPQSIDKLQRSRLCQEFGIGELVRLRAAGGANSQGTCNRFAVAASLLCFSMHMAFSHFVWFSFVVVTSWSHLSVVVWNWPPKLPYTP